MKKLLIVLMLLATPLYVQAQTPTYPATVDSMMQTWVALYEVCGELKVQPHDVHVQSLDTSNFVLKIEDANYVPFITTCEKKLSVKPLIRIEQQNGVITSFAVFEMELNWPVGKPSVLDTELKELNADGIVVLNKKILIYVISTGTVNLSKVVEYMGNHTSVVAGASPLPTTLPISKPATVPNTTIPPVK